jgi:hypothetical protein
MWNSSFGWGQKDHGGHLSRPVIVGRKLFVRPRTLDLLSGRDLKLNIPSKKCGTYCATSEMLIFRHLNLMLWDMKDAKTSEWHRLRPGCWLSTIPADGMLLSPEAGGGCSCGTWLETSVGFAPKALR